MNKKSMGAICLIIILSFLLCGCEVNLPNITNLQLIKKAPNCEAEVTKEQLIGIFKQNFRGYKHIDESTISEIGVYLPIAESYDKEIDKYFCSAQIYMKSTPEGFRGDAYYNGGIATRFYRKHNFKSYKSSRINYSSQLSEGEPVVMSSTDYGYAGFRE